MWKYSVNRRYCISCKHVVRKKGGGSYKDLLLYYCTRLPCTIDNANEFIPYTRVLGHGSFPDNSIYTFNSPRCPFISRTP